MSLTGKIEYNRYDYAAFDFRNGYSNFNSEESYLEDFTKSRFGLTVNNFSIQNKDSLLKPVKDTYSVKINNAITETDEGIIFNPTFFEQIKENPFKDEERKYPVDFAYASEKIVIIKIKLPANYTVSKLPQQSIFKLSDNSAKYAYSVSVAENILQLTCKLNLDNAIYLQTIYPELREFFNLIVKKNSEFVTIKKS